MWNLLKKDTNKLIYKTETDSQTYGYHRERGGKDKLGIYLWD